MEKGFGNSQKYEEDKRGSSEGRQRDNYSSNQNNLDSSKSMLARTLRRVNSDNSLMLNAKRQRSNKRCGKSAIMLQRFYLENRIPKDLVSLDEKYLGHCLELIHNSASKAGAFKILVDMHTPTMGLSSSDGLCLSKTRFGNHDNLMRLVLDCSLSTGNGDNGGSSPPPGQWIAGSIMGSKSMISIMKNPLFQRSNGDINLRISTTDSSKELSSDRFVGSSQNQLSSMFSSSIDHGKKTQMEGTSSYGTDTGHQRFVSMESRNSTSMDQSASPVGASSVSQGMLHVTWKDGIPHFVFSLDNQKEVYLTSLMNCSGGSPQYIYLFYSRVHVHDHKEFANPSSLVGKMKVTTSFTVCPNDSKIMKAEFVLSGTDETSGGTRVSDNNLIRRYKGLPKKVVDLFRNSKSSRQRSISKYEGTNANLETPSPAETCQEVSPSLDKLGGGEILPESCLPNLELAAIVVKNHRHVKGDRQVESGGGWGLKFLKKAEVKNTSDARLLSKCCSQSSAIDIIIPAGIHGGPRTINGGPSTLTERWRSGGQCDCGGWDLGCPLTVLKTKSSRQDSFNKADMEDKGKALDLYIQGSKQSIPTLRMTNLHEGLYLVHFQPNLSALQSFSIAVAHIHTQSHIP